MNIGKLVLGLLLSAMLSGTAALASTAPLSAAVAAEPGSDMYDFVQDGEFSQKLHFPTYEWIPKTLPPKGLILAVHGLSLHGATMSVLGRTCASYGYYMIAPDMRGFGRAYTDTAGKFGTGKDSKRIVNYHASVADLTQLAKLVKQKYKGLPLALLGESLGCSIAIHIAAENPDLVDSLVLSGPAVQVSNYMIFNPSNLGMLLHPIRGLDLKSFHRKIVSNDPQVVADAVADPLLRKSLTIPELLKTDREVSATHKYAKHLRKDIPVLVLQAGADKCNMPTGVTKLMASIKSTNQTIRWLDSYGHLNFESPHLRVGTIQAISEFADSQTPEAKAWMLEVGGRIRAVGGTLRK